MEDKFINAEARKLAKKIHIEEHLIKKSKLDEKHELYDWYYLMASGIYQNLMEGINDTYNLVVDLTEEIKKLKNDMKEVSKQQKYLWETLEEKKKK